MSPFSIDAAARLPGPEPLRQRRVAAAERLAALPWPSPDDEVWRYSRIAELDLERFAPATDGAASPTAPRPARGRSSCPTSRSSAAA